MKKLIGVHALVWIACGAALGSGLALAVCSDAGGTGGYSRLENHQPDFFGFTDECMPKRDEVCYDCTAWDRTFHEWIHCAENESGSWGSCAYYEDWDRIPPLI